MKRALTPSSAVLTALIIMLIAFTIIVGRCMAQDVIAFEEITDRYKFDIEKESDHVVITQMFTPENFTQDRALYGTVSISITPPSRSHQRWLLPMTLENTHIFATVIGLGPETDRGAIALRFKIASVSMPSREELHFLSGWTLRVISHPPADRVEVTE